MHKPLWMILVKKDKKDWTPGLKNELIWYYALTEEDSDELYKMLKKGEIKV